MLSRARSNIAIGITAVAGLLLAVGPATAQSVQGNKLNVQARIGELCTVSSASLDFGPGIDIDANNDAEGSIAIDCAAETSLSVQLDGGKQPGFNDRNMTDGESPLKYFLYKDSARSQLWAANEMVATTITSNGTVPVYGRVPIQSDGHHPGLYTDEVTITLVF